MPRTEGQWGADGAWIAADRFASHDVIEPESFVREDPNGYDREWEFDTLPDRDPMDAWNDDIEIDLFDCNV